MSWSVMALSNLETYTFFFRSQSPFSQWHPTPFEIDRMEFNCARQQYMYIRSINFSDFKRAVKIMNTCDPKKQKEGKWEISKQTYSLVGTGDLRAPSLYIVLTHIFEIRWYWNLP